MNAPTSPYYTRHIFFCLNQRDNGDYCCADQGAEAAFQYCKKCVKDLGLAGVGQVRVNKAGCMNRCAGAPVAVVYPEGVWYSYLDTDDIDEIISSHLQNGKIVERLLLAPDIGR